MATIEQQIKKAIQDGRNDRLVMALTNKFTNEDREQWDKDRLAEYEALFPATREETYEEYCTRVFAESEDNVVVVEEIYNDNYPKEHINIDYSDNADYVTYNEWLNETEVVTPAVEEVLDADGTVITPAVAEVTRRVREFVAGDYTAQVYEFMANAYGELRKVEYLPLEEQLDMLYKDMKNGSQEWLNHIDSVKSKYPKV